MGSLGLTDHRSIATHWQITDYIMNSTRHESRLRLTGLHRHGSQWQRCIADCYRSGPAIRLR